VSDKKRRLKSLSLKVEHLRLELEEREEALRKFESEFMSELSRIETEDLEAPVPPPAPPDVVSIPPAEVEAKGAPEQPEDVKKLWRMIAAATHPDRTGGDPEMTDLYKSALEAMNTGAIDELHRIASRLGIDTPETSEASLAALEALSKKLEAAISDSESSVLWMWGKTDPAKRTGIIDVYLGSRRKRRKKHRS